MKHGHHASRGRAHASRVPRQSHNSPNIANIVRTWPDIQVRMGCSVCQLVVAAVRSDLATAINPNQEINVLLFPSERCSRLSFPSALGISLAFVADDAEHAHTPDYARLVGPTKIEPSRILSWLEICEKQAENAQLRFYSGDGKHLPRLIPGRHKETCTSSTVLTCSPPLSLTLRLHSGVSPGPAETQSGIIARSDVIGTWLGAEYPASRSAFTAFVRRMRDGG